MLEFLGEPRFFAFLRRAHKGTLGKSGQFVSREVPLGKNLSTVEHLWTHFYVSGDQRMRYLSEAPLTVDSKHFFPPFLFEKIFFQGSLYATIFNQTHRYDPELLRDKGLGLKLFHKIKVCRNQGEEEQGPFQNYDTSFRFRSRDFEFVSRYARTVAERTYKGNMILKEHSKPFLEYTVLATVLT